MKNKSSEPNLRPSEATDEDAFALFKRLRSLLLSEPRTDYAPARGQVFRHFKGSLYELLSFARLSEDRNTEVVVYRSFETGQVWVRPLDTPGQDSWRDEVVWPDGVCRERFVPTQKRSDGQSKG